MSSELPLRILVIDCDEPLCAVTTEMLESLGHHAKGETDSLSALSLFSESPYEFDLAIVEPAMPDLMGLDLAVRLRRIRPGFPVLFYAGYADESLSSQIKTNGLGQVAFKPFMLNELAAAITERLSPMPHRQPA